MLFSPGTLEKSISRRSPLPQNVKTLVYLHGARRKGMVIREFSCGNRNGAERSFGRDIREIRLVSLSLSLSLSLQSYLQTPECH